jgi:heme/copper-type cytochrome/quinol oxidase subunit 4
METASKKETTEEPKALASSDINDFTKYNAFKSLKKGASGGITAIYNVLDTLIIQNITKTVFSMTKSGAAATNESIYFILLFSIIFFSSVILYFSSRSPNFLKNSTYTYATLIILPILAFLYYVSKMGSKDASIVLVGFLATTAVIAGLLYGYAHMGSTSRILFNFLFTIFVFLIVIFALAIIYNIFYNYLNKQEGISGFLIQFVFYIPCLVSDFIKWSFEQYKITPNIVFILFVIEVILILLYVYLPRLIRSLLEKSNKSKQLILQGVSYLDKRNVVASTDRMMTIFATPQPNNTYVMANQPADFNNFSISMWIYVNPQDFRPTRGSRIPSIENTVFEYNLFEFNSVTGDCPGGLPKITVLYDKTKNSLETYNVYFTNRPNPDAPDDPHHIHDEEYKLGKFKIHMTNQRWNHLVFNYNRNICDLYINGLLERSMSLVHCLPRITEFIDVTKKINSLQMSAGQDGGLYGAICNVEYYSTPLSNIEIITKYNLLMGQNPPTNNTVI